MKDTMLVVRMNSNIKDELSGAAKKEKMSMSELVHLAIIDYLYKLKKEGGKRNGATRKTRRSLDV